MIQNESGCEESQRWKRPACFDSRAAKSMAAPMSTVGASTAQTSNAIKQGNQRQQDDGKYLEPLAAVA